MALTYEQFMVKTKAEKVANQIIVGIKNNRKIVGTYKGGVFTLNDEGKKFVAEMNAPKEEPVAEEKPKRTRRKKEVLETPETDAELERLLLED
jgi:cobyric acid synthase